MGNEFWKNIFENSKRRPFVSQQLIARLASLSKRGIELTIGKRIGTVDASHFGARNCLIDKNGAISKGGGKKWEMIEVNGNAIRPRYDFTREECGLPSLSISTEATGRIAKN